MNPEIRDLIQRVLANEIPMDVFYARMGQLGVLPSEAQTMLSTASGGAQQGLDPALESARSQPLEPSAYNYAPAQTATASRDTYRPELSIADKLRSSPLARGIEIARAKVEGREPNFETGNGPAGAPSAGPASYSSMTPPSAGTTAGNLVARAIAQSPVQAPQAAPSPAAAQAAPYQPYYGSDDTPIGTAYNPAYTGDEQRFRPSGETIQQAINVAKARTAAAPQMASTQTGQTTEGPGVLAQLIRGRFGEAAKGSPYDDRLTPYQEERDRMGGMAKGGSVDAKPAKGDSLHKALEIIHHLITTR